MPTYNYLDSEEYKEFTQALLVLKEKIEGSIKISEETERRLREVFTEISWQR